MNRLIDPNELREMAAFYEEVRMARLMGTKQGQRAQGVAESRPLRGLPPTSRGASIVLNPGEVNKSVLEARPNGQDAEVMTLSIQAAPVNRSFTASDQSFSNPNTAVINGNLLWGIGQSTFQAFFDVLRGTTISLPANYLRLTVDYAEDFGVPPGGNPPFQINAGLAYGMVPIRSGPVRFTQNVEIADVAPAIVSVQIPPFAVAFTLLTAQLLPNGFVIPVNVTDALGGFQAQYFYGDFNPAFNNGQTNMANQNEQTFPIWNGAERLAIQNPLPASGILLKVIYTLAL